MTKDRNPGVVFDISNQLIGASRYDEVNVLVKIKK